VKRRLFFRSIAILLIGTIASGCANTIPSRADNAIPIYPTAFYPVRVFMFPLADKRPVNQKESVKQVSWPGSQGHIDYYGEKTESGLAGAIAEYLTASRVFNHVDMIDFIASESLLRSRGYRALLTANLEELDAGFSVPAWMLVIALLPIPFFGLTLLPLAVWPKEISFHAVLSDVRLKDLWTGQMIWSGKIEIRRIEKRTTSHFSAEWYLGEIAELVSKDLIRQLSAKKLRF